MLGIKLAKRECCDWTWWVTPVISSAQEAEI
jgi:hypothetical protein